MRSYLYRCDHCTQAFDSTEGKYSTVPYLCVRSLDIKFKFKRFCDKVTQDRGLWCEGNTGANNKGPSERHFCSGACLGKWVDERILQSINNPSLFKNNITKTSYKRMEFVDNGYSEDDISLFDN